MAIYTIVRQGREVRAEIAGRSRLAIEVVAGGGVVPPPNPVARKGRGRESTDGERLDCTVDPGPEGSPIHLTVRTSNVGDRTAHNLLWNFACPSEFLTDERLRDAELAEAEVRDTGAARVVVCREEHLHPGVSFETTIPLRRPRPAESCDVAVFLAQNDQRARHATIRITNNSQPGKAFS